MPKETILLSSVQTEFAAIRQAVSSYIREDELLMLFFDVFLFKEVAATGDNPGKVYLHEVKKADIHLGILGVEYGFEDSKSFSVMIWRTSSGTDQVTAHDQLFIYLEYLRHRLLWILDGELCRDEMMERLGFTHRTNINENYLDPATEYKWIEMTIPDNPKSKKQCYRLTKAGLEIKQKIAHDYK
ncbi:DUF4062 domain-containing protein [Lunatibacter salilacus]|uniref:DUF4062 domain-containing protein n=1 Tax=Lunatibacter salilacus TaxID=2483804 RepID=UPI00131AB306|nr:DUF4062 domain-containing protein [Lunatibacter salilacus]